MPVAGGLLRLSLDVTAVPERPVGAGRYTIELAGALARRDDVGLVLWTRRRDAGRWRGEETGGARQQPTVGGPPRGRTALAAVQVEARAPENRVGRLAWERLALSRLLGASGADVHHGPHYTMPGRSRVPMVVTIHDLTFFDHPEWHERTKVVFFRRAIRRAAAGARAVVCVSTRTAERLQERLPVHARVFVVPHGVDHDRFRPEEAEPGGDDDALARLGVRPPYLLFLGTLEPRKAVPDLVHAFAAVAAHQRELTLVLAGSEGWGSAAVTRAVAECAVGDRVRKTGYVPEDAVPALLRKAAAVAYPAHEEGFGLPALEALACGTPLVTTTGTVMADVAGGAALLVPAGRPALLAEALGEVLAGGSEVERRRRVGMQLAAAHTWERSAKGHVEAYRWAAQGGGGRPPGGRGRGR
jgi:glycosyltransferase involved in cell wall biosynthesis